MSILTLVYGMGNAKAKRARRGMEKDHNRYDESLKKLMAHGDSMKTSKRWLEFKRKKDKEIKEDID
jgi:hypothetical protein